MFLKDFYNTFLHFERFKVLNSTFFFIDG